MKDYDLILTLYDTYNSTDRKDIVDNLNKVIASRKNIMPVDRYITLPKVTGKSKHTVMSWFNRDNVKIPLQHLCVLSNYLNCEISCFIKLPDVNYGENISTRFTELYNKYKNINKTNLVHNIEKYYGTMGDMVVNRSDKRKNRITNICGCNSNTYHAWFNLSRASVKIPFIMLCKLAKDAEVELSEFLI